MDYNIYLNNTSNSQMSSSYDMYPYCNNLSNVSSELASNQLSANRFVYVNHNFVNSVHSTSILINPNFKKTVHINPNFRTNASMKTTIHVNPDILKFKKPDDMVQKKESQVKSTSPVSTCTKLNRASDKSTKQSDTPAKRKRRKSVHTTYKIIRSIRCETPSSQKSYYTKTKFKLDKSPPNRFKKNFTPLMPSVAKNVIIKHKASINKSKFLNINGTLYKRTPNVLLAKSQIYNMTKKNKVLLIGGHVYKLDSNRRTLKRMDLKENNTTKINVKPIDIAGVPFKQKTSNVKSTANKKLLLMKYLESFCFCNILINADFSQTTRKDVRLLPNKLKKCNLSCPFYRKFGNCKGKENGSCICIHDPNQIALCTRFLQGACIDKNCLLSHKVSPEKMPTCKYFLEGLCSKEDCPYLHVKISAKAAICKDFLEGFCKNAKKCDKRHQFLCPNFERDGTCIRKSCPFPHGRMVRQLNKIQNKVAKSKISKFNILTHSVEETEVNCRYYKGKEQKTDKNIVDTDVGTENKNNIDNVLIGELNSKPRKELGYLPSFIPLGQPKSD